MAPLRMKQFYDTTFTMEDPDTHDSHDVPIQIRRFNKETWEAFQRDFKRMSDPPSNRLVLVRHQDGDEQERDEKTNAFKVSNATVMARRLTEMSADQRAAYEIQNQEDETFVATFIRDSIAQYVIFPDNALEVEAESGAIVAIRTGADFVEQFASRGDLLQRLIEIILEENTMSPLEKKVRRSLSALKTSSGAHLPDPDGARPAVTAEPVGSGGSAASDIAMEVSATTPSGSEMSAANP